MDTNNQELPQSPGTFLFLQLSQNSQAAPFFEHDNGHHDNSEYGNIHTAQVFEASLFDIFNTAPHLETCPSETIAQTLLNYAPPRLPECVIVVG